MGYLKPYWKNYRLRFILAVLFLSLEALADLMQPALMSRIVDQGVAHSKFFFIEKFGLIMFLITLGGAFCACMRNVLSVNVSQNFARDLRQDLYIKIQRFSLKNIDRFGNATLITRLTNDVTRVQTFANGLMRMMLKAPLVGIGSLIMAVNLNPKLSLILLGVTPVIALMIYLNMKISYPYFRKVQGALDHVNRSVQEYLSGVRVVKVFNRFSYEEERFQQNNQHLGNLSAMAAKVGSVFSPLINLAVNAGIIAIIWFGGIGVESGSMQVGSIIAFTNYMMQILFAIMMVNNAFNMFVRAKASAERIGEIMNTEEDMAFPEQENRPIAKKKGALLFQHVCFSYDSIAGQRDPFLKNIDFSVLPGEMLGITGPIASGKTTLVNLILRFYDPDQGRLILDGTDVRLFSEEELRGKIALVPQRPLLFSGTVRENIRWGNEQASEEEIYEAARAAEADEFIRQTPDGYDSMIGQGGVNFSGGQKQRISIARALIRKPEILILDDATSAVDARTDKRIRRNISIATRRLTCIVISQRITSIADADKIIVMNGGKIDAIGTHQELIRESDYYREILQSQLGKEVESNG
ncbi:ABC transporter ATP-binding protein [Sporolactobacillus shoreae]|uniref:ABC transporter ATP-binding protein n=1 Tax=Sporolactobacillus shoreae TaxID=1465501 RepID=A0A4Z0GVY2_9BACL|nr:ABC transporter ATP-binding protein [Sporolactobacillus shoreae]TGB00446.1 ABC transporter ATP-binding protein [Sporolactobacillus shoreae]